MLINSCTVQINHKMASIEQEIPEVDEEDIELLFQGPGLDIPTKRPTHWNEVFDITSVSERYRPCVAALLDEFQTVFSLHVLDIGRVTDPELAMSIEVKALPKKQRCYPVPEPLVPHFRQIIEELVELGVIAPATSPVSSPAFILPKNSREKVKMQQMKQKGEVDYDRIRYRLCVDYRELNRNIIPRWSGETSVSHVYDVIKHKRLVCSFDISSSFFQIPIKEECQYLTMMSCSNGIGSYKYLMSPMGCCSSPTALQYVMSHVLNPRFDHPTKPGKVTQALYPHNIAAYMDDLYCAANDEEEMETILRALFTRLLEVGIKLSLKKATFYRDNFEAMDVLGFSVNASGKRITSTKLELSRDMNRPTTVRELQKLLGFYTYLSSHIANYQDMICSLTDALSHNRGKLKWTATMETAFQKLKEAVALNQCLYHIDYSLDLYIHSDASENAAGMVLMQFDCVERQVRIIAYHSYKFPAAIRSRYSIVAKEGLSLVLAVQKWLPELMAARRRIAIVDNMAISFILSGSRAGNSRLGRLAMTLLSMPIHVVIKHRHGTQNMCADVLSRFFCTHQPHLKLKNANALTRGELKPIDLQEGELTTIQSVHQTIQNDSSYVLPFLRNPNDVDKLQQEQYINEIHCLSEDLVEVVYTDPSIEAQHYKALLDPLLSRVECTVNHLSLAAKEITWEKLIKFQVRDTRVSQLREATMRKEPNTIQYRIHNGLLCRKRYPDKPWDEASNSLIVIPLNGELISYIISSFHYSHHGIRKIWNAIRQIFYVPQLRQHVASYCNGCAICARLRVKTQPKDPEAHLFVPSSPMQVIDLDFMIMKPAGRFKYVLNICDRYSRKLMAVPTTRMTSGVVVKELQKLFSLFGAPQYLNGDNQISLLRSRESLAFLTQWGTAIRTGIPYNSTSQSIIETMNGSLKFMLKAMCEQHKSTSWNELLPSAIYLLNNVPSSSLPSHLTPDSVFFGRSTSPFPLGRHKVSGHLLPEENAKTLQETHNRNKTAVDLFIAKRRQLLKDHPEPKRRGRRFAVGDHVYFRKMQPGIKDKFDSKYVNTVYVIERLYGSWVVIRDVYKVTSAPHRLTTSVHFLKEFSKRDPFLFNHIKPDMVEVGGPLEDKDFPVSSDPSIVPSVYNPNAKSPPKPVRPLPSTHSTTMPESNSHPDFKFVDSEDGINSPPRDHQPLPLLDYTTKRPAAPPSETLDNDSSPSAPVDNGSRNFTSWLKNAFKIIPRQTRSGAKF